VASFKTSKTLAGFEEVRPGVALFLQKSGTFVIVKSSIFTPFEICFHVNGIDTVAFGFARAVNTAARLLPLAFCIQST
jgi:hypothetical protein